jgi:tetratricopeptide (TPR) repeat protein
MRIAGREPVRRVSRRGPKASAGIVAFVAVVFVAANARADFASGRAKLDAGDYKAAIAELGKVTGKDRGAARVQMARAQLATGDLAGALATANALAKDKDAAVAAHARVVAAQALREAGKAAEAQKDLEPLYKSRPDDRRVRHQLSLALLEQGLVKEAAPLLQRTMDEFDSRAIDLDDPEQLFFLAEAGRLTSQYELANDSYREATSLAPHFTHIGVAWADLFLQKYASALAEETLEAVFKVNPNQPDAHAAMAAVQVESSYDLKKVSFHVDKALEVNPKHQRALLVRASIEIDQNGWDAAHKSIDAVLALNPNNVEALAMRATIHWLRDDLKAYEAEKQKALKINPAYAELYRIVARSAVREHRYVEAIELEKQAVALRPKYFEAMSGVGLGYLRLGNETEGLAWLKKSWDGDQYNVRTFNTLDLFEKTIPKEYAFSSTKSFKIRYHRDEQKILGRYLEPMLERAFADMVKRYGFTPKTPVVLELYTDAADYAIRTVGLPSLGALGVCFGQVITAMSPSNGDINWGMVLWHELAHVFAIQLSKSRVPRWYTEGLSEYETLIAHPAWRRENDADLYGAVVDGTLPSVTELNHRFMVGDSTAVVVAYYTSAVTIEYIAQTYGFPKLVEGLKLFGAGKETHEVIPAITGRTVAQFDADFRKYLDVRLAAYKGTFRIPQAPSDDITALEIAVAAKPKDATAQARLAHAHYGAGDADKAFAAADAATKLDPKHPLARYLLAEIALRTGDVPGARKMYEGLIASGHDNFDFRVRLATIAQSEGKADELEKQLCAAKKLDPERSYPYQELAELYDKTGRTADSLRELEQYAFLEQMQLAPAKALVLGHAKQAAWAKVKTFAEHATYINPADSEILLALGKAYHELGELDRAEFTYDSALLARPALRRPAIAHIGRARALLARGKRVEARAAIQAALKTEPENAEALELRGQIK